LPGYPQLSSWLASDPNFAIGRDYADLRVRVRLHKQFEVEKLKKELKGLDERQYSEEPDILKSIEDEIQDGYGERNDLIQRIDKALKEFGKFASLLLNILRIMPTGKCRAFAIRDYLTRLIDEIQLRERDYRALPRLSKRNYHSVLSHLYYGDDLEGEEEFFMYPREAISLAAGTQNSWLDEKIEKLLDRIPGSQVLKASYDIDV
jgi:hypothetical protein